MSDVGLMGMHVPGLSWVGTSGRPMIEDFHGEKSDKVQKFLMREESAGDHAAGTR